MSDLKLSLIIFNRNMAPMLKWQQKNKQKQLRKNYETDLESRC